MESGIDSQTITKRHSMLDHDVATTAVTKMSKNERMLRRSYLSQPSDELRKICSERNIDPKKYETADRANLLRILEEEDGMHTDSWVHNRAFEGFFIACVLLNVSCIAIQIDHSYLLSAHVWQYVNFGWFLVFLLEAVLKVCALGWKRYSKDPWNEFDVVVLVLVAVQILAMSFVSVADSRVYQRYAAIVPQDVVQLVRICRLFRLASFFKELGMLIQSFLSSIKALVWIMVLLFIWFYIAACVATIFVGRREFLPSEDETEIKELREKFATIPLSMFALFEVMTLEGWVDYVRPLLHTRPALVAFFLFFIFVSSFFMLNLITAVVVDRTVAAQQSVDDQVTEEETLMRKSRISLICAMLRRASGSPEDKSPGSDEVFVTKEDFERVLSDSEIREVMRELGWSKHYMNSMFDLTDTDQSGEVSVLALQRLLEASHESLNTTSFVRFQLNLMHRLEHQENLVLTVLDSLEKSNPGKVTLPDAVQERLARLSLDRTSSPRGSFTKPA